MVLYTAWKLSVFRVFLVCILLRSDWIRRDNMYLSVFCQYAGKFGPEKLRIRTLFTQWYTFKHLFVLHLLFCISTTPENCSFIEKWTLTHVLFLCVLQNFVNFFIEHLLTTASETATKNRLGNSKLLIIISVDVGLGFWMGHYTEGYFEKEDEKWWKQGDTRNLNDWIAEFTKGIANFFEYQNHILTLTTFLETPLH